MYPATRTNVNHNKSPPPPLTPSPSPFLPPSVSALPYHKWRTWRGPTLCLCLLGWVWPVCCPACPHWSVPGCCQGSISCRAGRVTQGRRVWLGACPGSWSRAGDRPEGSGARRHPPTGGLDQSRGWWAAGEGLPGWCWQGRDAAVRGSAACWWPRCGAACWGCPARCAPLPPSPGPPPWGRRPAPGGLFSNCQNTNTHITRRATDH